MSVWRKSHDFVSNIGHARQPEETTGLLAEISAAEDLPNASSTDLYSASDAEGCVRISNFLKTCFDRIILFLRGATEFCSSPNCDVTKQQQCVQIVKRYNSSPSEPEEAISPSDPHEEYQILRHIVLLLILSCSMFVVSALLKILTNFPLLRKVFFRVSLFVCGPSL
jgi:hypothetical protein